MHDFGIELRSCSAPNTHSSATTNISNTSDNELDSLHQVCRMYMRNNRHYSILNYCKTNSMTQFVHMEFACGAKLRSRLSRDSLWSKKVMLSELYTPLWSGSPTGHQTRTYTTTSTATTISILSCLVGARWNRKAWWMAYGGHTTREKLMMVTEDPFPVCLQGRLGNYQKAQAMRKMWYRYKVFLGFSNVLGFCLMNVSLLTFKNGFWASRHRQSTEPFCTSTQTIIWPFNLQKHASVTLFCVQPQRRHIEQPRE